MTLSGLTVEQEHAGFAGDRALDNCAQGRALGLATDQDWLDTHSMIIRPRADPRRCLTG